MKIHILDRAKQDLKDGFYFYDAQQKGLGGYFHDSLFADIDSLVLYAGIHAKFYGYHRLLAKRFPFAIYYKIKNDNVYVYAILDCRKEPAWVKDRLTTCS